MCRRREGQAIAGAEVAPPAETQHGAAASAARPPRQLRRRDLLPVVQWEVVSCAAHRSLSLNVRLFGDVKHAKSTTTVHDDAGRARSWPCAAPITPGGSVTVAPLLIAAVRPPRINL